MAKSNEPEPEDVEALRKALRKSGFVYGSDLGKILKPLGRNKTFSVKQWVMQTREFRWVPEMAPQGAVKFASGASTPRTSASTVSTPRASTSTASTPRTSTPRPVAEYVEVADHSLGLARQLHQRPYETAISIEEFLAEALDGASARMDASKRPFPTLLDAGDAEKARDAKRHVGFLGATGATGGLKAVFLNTSDPFCFVVCGVQGSGKSHTVACVVESCILSVPPIVSTPAGPPATLILHYDRDPFNFCELMTLGSAARRAPLFKRPEITVLVSPNYLRQRRKYYKDVDNVKVLPLLFSWSSLSADQLRTLLRVDLDSEKQPLYIDTLLDLLRKAQRTNKRPSVATFRDQLLNGSDLVKGQQGPLLQRLRLLESFVVESEINKEEHNLSEAVNLEEIFDGKAVIVCDLTDPLQSAVDAAAIFDVLIASFRRSHCSNKLLVLDEAHKYLDPTATSGLTDTVIEIARQMRHHGMRLVVSTQDPRTLPEPLLGLVSTAFVHRCQSREWLRHLSRSVTFTEAHFDAILGLPTGVALVAAMQISASLQDPTRQDSVTKIAVRKRLTRDGGESRRAEDDAARDAAAQAASLAAPETTAPEPVFLQAAAPLPNGAN